MPAKPADERWWWMSSKVMTIMIRTHGDVIVSAPPIARKFVGQRSAHLVRWMRRQGGLRIEELTRVA